MFLIALKAKQSTLLVFLLLILTGCLFLFATPTQTSAQTTYYISPAGSDNNSGTSESAPWATFRHAFTAKENPTKVRAGDTLILLDGVYHQSLNPGSVDGTPEAHITIRAKNDGEAIIDGDHVLVPVNFTNRKYFLIEGIVAQNSSAAVYSLHGASHLTFRRVSGFNANTDDGPNVFRIGSSNNILVEDCFMAGTGRKMMSIHGASFDNTVRRCFIDWHSWDGRNNHNLWPWGEDIDIYNSDNNLLENIISYGTTARASITIRANQSTSTANNNKILGTISVFSSMNKSKTPMEPVVYPETRPQPSIQDPYAVLDMTRPETRVGFFMLGPGSLRNTFLQDIFSYYNASYGLVLAKGSFDANPADSTIERATFIHNTQEPTRGGEHGTDAILQDLNKFTVRDSVVGKIWDTQTNTYSSLSGQGARIKYRYMDGVLTNEPLWPWPMEDRIREEYSREFGIHNFSVTNTITPILAEYGALDEIVEVPTPTPTPIPTTTPIPGDANGDGKVDGLDYVIWLNNYGRTDADGPQHGDFNSDARVDGLDYVIWLNNYTS